MCVCVALHTYNLHESVCVVLHMYNLYESVCVVLTFLIVQFYNLTEPYQNYGVSNIRNRMLPIVGEHSQNTDQKTYNRKQNLRYKHIASQPMRALC